MNFYADNLNNEVLDTSNVRYLKLYGYVEIEDRVRFIQYITYTQQASITHHPEYGDYHFVVDVYAKKIVRRPKRFSEVFKSFVEAYEKELAPLPKYINGKFCYEEDDDVSSSDSIEPIDFEGFSSPSEEYTPSESYEEVKDFEPITLEMYSSLTGENSKSKTYEFNDLVNEVEKKKPEKIEQFDMFEDYKK